MQGAVTSAGFSGNCGPAKLMVADGICGIRERSYGGFTGIIRILVSGSDGLGAQGETTANRRPLPIGHLLPVGPTLSPPFQGIDKVG